MQPDAPQPAAAPPHLDLILYGKPDCPLCDRLEAMLRPHIDRLRGRVTIRVTKRDINDNPTWHDWYRYRIPVLTHEDRAVLEGRPSEGEVADVIEAAAAAAIRGGPANSGSPG